MDDDPRIDSRIHVEPFKGYHIWGSSRRCVLYYSETYMGETSLKQYWGGVTFRKAFQLAYDLKLSRSRHGIRGFKKGG